MKQKNDIKFSCEQDKFTAEYSLMTDGPFPMPKGDTYFWHIANFTPDMDKQKIILAFDRMFQKWQDAIDEIEPVGRVIKLKSTPDISKAHFIYRFVKKKHTYVARDKVERQCPKTMDGAGGVLARMWTLEAGEPMGGQCHLDEAENWGEMHSRDHRRLFIVLLHEQGHGFGIGHSEFKTAVMGPFYNPELEEFSEDDNKAISTKLGPVKREVFKSQHRFKNMKVDKFALLPKSLQWVLTKIYGHRWN